MAIIDRLGASVSAVNPNLVSNPNPGLAIKTAVAAATTAAITLSGAQTIDGYAAVSGDRILVKDQSDETTNGIYNVSTGNWTRALDANGNTEWEQGTIVLVLNGTASDTLWQQTNEGPITVGTDDLTFGQIIITADAVAFDTRAAADVASIASTVNHLRTAGYTTTGDGGGGLYKKVLATTPGGFQSADGAWWQLVETQVNVKQFGAACNGTTDDSAAIALALTAGAVSDAMQTVFIPAPCKFGPLTITGPAKNVDIQLGSGTFTIAGTITWESLQGASFKGSNWNNSATSGTQLTWAGNSADPMFSLSRCQMCYLGGFNINSSAGTPLDTAIQTMSTTTGLVPTHCTFEQISIEGGSAGGLQYGFRIGVPGAGTGNNNEFHEFHKCIVNNYEIAACSILQAQAKNMLFKHFVFLGNGIGFYGVTTQEGGGGSFLFDGGGGGGNTAADFALGNTDDVIVISGVQSEGSDRFLITSTSSNAWPVIIRDCRISCGNVNADLQIIKYGHRGPFTFINNSVECDSQAIKINLISTGRTQGVAIGNSVSDGTLANPFTTDDSAFGRWLQYGNTVGPNGAPVPYPMIVPVLTVAELPATGNARGQLVLLTDSLSPNWGAIPVTGGTKDVLAFYNGDEWSVLGSEAKAAVALVEGSTINTDASLGTVFTVTLAGNRILGNPTNMITGEHYEWRITQGSTGDRLLTYGTSFTFPGGGPAVSTGANAVDVINATYDGTKLRAVLTKNYST